MRKRTFSIEIYLCCLSWFFFASFFFTEGEIFATDTGNDTEYVHRVSAGETLNKIARRYLPLTEALTVGELIHKIREINGIQKSLIRPKQRLMIPLIRSRPVTAKTVPKPIDFEARGLYVNRYTMACRKMTRLLDQLMVSKGNTVVLDAKDMSGRLSYSSSVNLAAQIGASRHAIISDLPKLFDYLHQRGLHVCVRIVAFYDPLLAAKRPELALRSTITDKPCTENGKVAWLDPSADPVQRYNIDIAKELAEMGADEIQFDYVRYPAMEHVQSATVNREKREIPRHKIIQGFLGKAQEELSPYKVLLAIDVFGIIAWGRPKDIQTIGQEIDGLAQHCDVICPMIYPSHFYGRFQGIAHPANEPFLLVSETCRRFSTFLEGSNVTLRPWIQSFPFGTARFSEEYIIEELRALAQSTSRGWLLWSAGNAYDVAWKALATWNGVEPKGFMASIQPFFYD